MFYMLLTNTTNTDVWSENVGVFISSAITILGFIVTYFLSRKNLKDEIQKTKGNKAIELMQEVPYELLGFLRGLGKSDMEEALNKLNKVISTVCAYGSPSAVKILEEYQKEIYSQSPANKDINPLFAYLGLLISQIKFDITGEIMSPESWLKIKIKDYSKIQKDIAIAINRLVDENNLDKRFKVKVDKNV